MIDDWYWRLVNASWAVREKFSQKMPFATLSELVKIPLTLNPVDFWCAGSCTRCSTLQNMYQGPLGGSRWLDENCPVAQTQLPQMPHGC